MDIFLSNINGISIVEALTSDGMRFIYEGEIHNSDHADVLIKIFEVQINRKELNIEYSEEWRFRGVINHYIDH